MVSLDATTEWRLAFNPTVAKFENQPDFSSFNPNSADEFHVHYLPSIIGLITTVSSRSLHVTGVLRQTFIPTTDSGAISVNASLWDVVNRWLQERNLQHIGRWEWIPWILHVRCFSSPLDCSGLYNGSFSTEIKDIIRLVTHSCHLFAVHVFSRARSRLVNWLEAKTIMNSRWQCGVGIPFVEASSYKRLRRDACLEIWL